jgi:hypothetical protein
MTIFSHILQVENALTLHTRIEFEMPALLSFPSLGFLEKYRLERVRQIQTKDTVLIPL